MLIRGWHLLQNLMKEYESETMHYICLSSLQQKTALHVHYISMHYKVPRVFLMKFGKVPINAFRTLLRLSRIHSVGLLQIF